MSQMFKRLLQGESVREILTEDGYSNTKKLKSLGKKLGYEVDQSSFAVHYLVNGDTILEVGTEGSDLVFMDSKKKLRRVDSDKGFDLIDKFLTTYKSDKRKASSIISDEVLTSITNKIINESSDSHLYGIDAILPGSKRPIRISDNFESEKDARDAVKSISAVAYRPEDDAGAKISEHWKHRDKTKAYVIISYYGDVRGFSTYKTYDDAQEVADNITLELYNPDDEVIDKVPLGPSVGH